MQATELYYARHPYHIMHTAQRTRKEKMKKLEKEEEKARGSGWKSLVSLKEEEGEREEDAPYRPEEQRGKRHPFFLSTEFREVIVRADGSIRERCRW